MNRHLVVALSVLALLPSLPVLRGDSEADWPDMGNEPQGCKINRRTSIGRATQGGFHVQYQSASGPHCRWYRTRNTPNHVFAPVLWTDKKEILILADLPDSTGGGTTASAHFGAAWQSGMSCAIGLIL